MGHPRCDDHNFREYPYMLYIFGTSDNTYNKQSRQMILSGLVWLLSRKFLLKPSGRLASFSMGVGIILFSSSLHHHLERSSRFLRSITLKDVRQTWIIKLRPQKADMDTHVFPIVLHKNPTFFKASSFFYGSLSILKQTCDLPSHHCKFTYLPAFGDGELNIPSCSKCSLTSPIIWWYETAITISLGPSHSIRFFGPPNKKHLNKTQWLCWILIHSFRKIHFVIHLSKNMQLESRMNRMIHQS